MNGYQTYFTCKTNRNTNKLQPITQVKKPLPKINSYDTFKHNVCLYSYNICINFVNSFDIPGEQQRNHVHKFDRALDLSFINTVVKN